jgi:hypothetical protein
VPLELWLELMPGQLPLGIVPVEPGGAFEVELDGVLVPELVDCDEDVDPVFDELPVVALVELELGVVVVDVLAAKATEVPTPASTMVKPRAAKSCFVRRFMVGYLTSVVG